jgi:hypothetical protein
VRLAKKVASNRAVEDERLLQLGLALGETTSSWPQLGQLITRREYGVGAE